MVRGVGLIAGALLGAGCVPAVFVCQTDPQCGEGGQCEQNGRCSVADEMCPGGRRYVEHAGDVAGECVGGGSAGSTGETTTASTSTTGAMTATQASSTTLDPTTTTDPMTSSTTTPVGSSGDGSTGETSDGLVAWYPMESVQEGGTPDATDNGLDATCDGDECPTADAGRIGGAARFDGVDDLLRVPPDPRLDLADAFTVAFWVQLDVATIPEGIFYHFFARPYGDGSGNSMEVYVRGLSRGDGTTLGYRVASDAIVVPITLTADIWMHLAVTYGDGNRVVYLDGEVFAESPLTGSVPYDEHDFYLGADEDAGQTRNFLAGALDDVRVYDRALGPDEVAALAGM
jgi:hypothetical protein